MLADSCGYGVGVMEIELLNEFLVLTQCLNYRSAAEKLFISQSVLSRHIQNLESLLGVALFERNRHSVILTPSGELFAKDAKKIIDEYKKAMQHMKIAKEGKVGKLDISTSKTLGPFFVYDFLVEFEKKYPFIQVNIHVEDGDLDHVQNVQSGLLDCAIILNWKKTHADLLNGYTFFKDPLYIIVPKDHPFAQNKSIRIDQLQGENILSFSKKENPYAFSFFETIFSKHGIAYTPSVFVPNIELLFYRIISGDGISIITGTALGAVPSGLTAVKIEDENDSVDVDIIWHSESENLSVPVFLEEFKKFSKARNQSNK